MTFWTKLREYADALMVSVAENADMLDPKPGCDCEACCCQERS